MRRLSPPAVAARPGACVAAAHGRRPPPAKLEYNRDIRPILAENCFACHGPDSAARKADLRLDRRDDAVEAGAIVPGKPDESELIERIYSADADEVMPPPKTQQEADRRAEGHCSSSWIAAGAEYQPHWSFIAADAARRCRRSRTRPGSATRSTASSSRELEKRRAARRPRRPTAARWPAASAST